MGVGRAAGAGFDDGFEVCDVGRGELLMTWHTVDEVGGDELGPFFTDSARRFVRMG